MNMKMKIMLFIKSLVPPGKHYNTGHNRWYYLGNVTTHKKINQHLILVVIENDVENSGNASIKTLKYKMVFS